MLVADESEAARICEDAAAFGLHPLLLPARDLSLRSMESASREYEQQRLGVLAKMAAGDYDIVVSVIDAAVQFTLPPNTLTERTLKLKSGLPLEVSDLAAALIKAGYERCEQVEGAGQFAKRGGIYDVFPADCPTRSS